MLSTVPIQGSLSTGKESCFCIALWVEFSQKESVIRTVGQSCACVNFFCSRSALMVGAVIYVFMFSIAPFLLRIPQERLARQPTLRRVFSVRLFYATPKQNRLHIGSKSLDTFLNVGHVFCRIWIVGCLHQAKAGRKHRCFVKTHSSHQLLGN